MDYYKNIQELIEKDIVLKKKHRLIENDSTLKTYYEIGRNIVEAQGGEKHAKYGNDLINTWSKQLTEKYGKGYDSSNLRRMRQLYLTFENCGTLSHKLSWSHYYSILSIKEESKRNYYINISIKQNLSVRQLREKIKNNEYERLEYKDNIEIIMDDSMMDIKTVIKDPLLIKVNKEVGKLSEKALKKYILNQIEEFLLEIGYGFTYYGSEVKLGNYKCDLLFYNVEFRRYVVIELKIRKLMPSDVGQIHLYKNYIDANMKKNYMNDTIGIVLCREKDRVIIEYMTDENIFFSTYQLT